MNISAIEIFKILNFIVVVILFVYLVRRYGVLQIMMMMRQEKGERQSIKDHLKELSVDCDLIDQQMSDQERSYRTMKDKFQIWHTYVLHHDEQEQKQFESRQETIAKKQLQKLQSLQQRRIVHKQLPELLQEVAQELEQNFANNKEQKEKYTTQLLKILEKNDV